MSSRRQQQQDAVLLQAPSSFLCPILMEIMADPVTLHTGISYDRVSIETWLCMGHNTCPITNQPLRHHDLIPNHALRRAILAWRHAHGNANPGFDGLHELTTLLHSIAHSGAHHLSSQLHQLSRALPRLDDEDKRSLFADPNRCNSGCNSTLAVRLCCLLSCGSDSSRFTKVNAAEILHALYKWDPTLHTVDPTHGHSEAAIQGLVTFLKEESQTPTSVTSGLRCLLSLCLVSKKNRVVAIEWKAVNVAMELLIISQKECRRPNVEYCCGVLEVLATCAEGREAISVHPFGVTRIAEPLLGVSNVATEHAVGALWGLLSLAADRRGVMEMAMQAGVFTRLLMVMSSECNQQAKGKVKHMLKMLNEVCG